MTAVLMIPPYLQFFNDDGVPLAGGFVYTYTATGTFTVPKATYTTATGNIEAPNPIELDASGRPTTGNGGIWISGTYDFKVTDSLGNIIETQFNVTAFTALPPSADAYFQSFSGNGTTTTFITSNDLGADEKAIYVWVDNGLQQNVTNGTFTTDAGWTKGAGWTIATGTAIATGAISTALSQTAAVMLIPSEAYVLTYTVTRSAGGIIPSIGGTNGVERTASGTYTEVISCGTMQTLAFTGNAFTGTLDNISITIANPKGYDIQNPTNYTISNTTLTFATAPASGTNNIYVSAPSLLVGAASSSAADAAASAADAAASAMAASDSEDAAAISAATAANYAASLSSTSITSLVIGTGAKTFTTQANKQYSAGQYLIVSSVASALNFMHGTVTSYSGTTLIMNITDIGGSGTLANWNISLSGTQGPTGAAGASGNLVLLQTQSASNSASISFSSTYLTTTYKHYILEIIDLIVGTNAVSLYLVGSVDNGSNYLAGTNYQYYMGDSGAGNATFNAEVSTGAAQIALVSSITLGTGTGQAYNSIINIYDPLNTTTYKMLSLEGAFYASSDEGKFASGMGIIRTLTAINNIKIVTSSGNIASGIFKLYGVV